MRLWTSAFLLFGTAASGQTVNAILAKCQQCHGETLQMSSAQGNAVRLQVGVRVFRVQVYRQGVGNAVRGVRNEEVPLVEIGGPVLPGVSNRLQGRRDKMGGPTGVAHV